MSRKKNRKTAGEVARVRELIDQVSADRAAKDPSPTPKEEAEAKPAAEAKPVAQTQLKSTSDSAQPKAAPPKNHGKATLSAFIITSGPIWPMLTESLANCYDRPESLARTVTFSIVRVRYDKAGKRHNGSRDVILVLSVTNIGHIPDITHCDALVIRGILKLFEYQVNSEKQSSQEGAKEPVTTRNLVKYADERPILEGAEVELWYHLRKRTGVICQIVDLATGADLTGYIPTDVAAIFQTP